MAALTMEEQNAQKIYKHGCNVDGDDALSDGLYFGGQQCGRSKDKDQAMDTGFTASTAGSYDSADTAVVTTIDQENSAAVFMNMETGRQYTLYYDGTTYVKDKHDGPMTISQIKPGDVVDVTFLKGKKHLASIKRSPRHGCMMKSRIMIWAALIKLPVLVLLPMPFRMMW